MKTSNIKTVGTYLPIFNGFYGSFWSDPDFSGEAEHYGLPENFPFYDYVNYSDYYDELSIQFCSIVENISELKPFIKKVSFNLLDSPRYYNFTNDKIDCNITIDVDTIKEYIYTNKNAFERHLVRHHKSRDGFMSYYDHTFDGWMEYTKDFTNFDHDPYVILASILKFIANNEGIEEDVFYYETDVYISNYYTNEFYEIVEGKCNEVAPFIQENYLKMSNDELLEAIELKYEDSDYLKIIIETAKETIKDIENHTLKLELQ